MKHLSRLLAGALLVSLTACSSDEPTPGNNTGGTDSADPFYSTISFKMPGSRSDSTNEGEEVGQDYENNVGSILVILATSDGEGDAADNGPFKYLTYAHNDEPASTSDNSKFTITFQDKERLFKQAGKTVYVFAYCNPTDALSNKVIGTTYDATTGKYTDGLAEGADFADLICGDDAANGDNSNVALSWRKNAFLMTSVAIHKVTLEEEADLKKHNTPDNAFDLCPGGKSIEVIRTASRFDIKDASANKDWSYEIKNDKLKDKPVMGTVTLTRVAMFNMRKQFYYLPRVHAKGVKTNTLCPGMTGMEFGVDENGNVTDEVFVVSPTTKTFDWANISINPNADDVDMEKLAGLEWTSLASLSDDDDDNGGWDVPAGTETPAPTKDGYKIWRYTSENTFAEDETKFEPNNTSGVVFEAEITVGENFGNKTENGEYLPMYLYQGVLYGSSLKIAEAIEQNPSSTLTTVFEQCFDITRDENNKVTSATLKTGADLNKFQLTEYKPTAFTDDKNNITYKYLCYYWYYNRHVDDETPSAVGPMEFATVRNNIYKLSVKNVKTFGTTTPPDPDAWDVYFTLNVEMKNWVVRVNDKIEF